MRGSWVRAALRRLHRSVWRGGICVSLVLVLTGCAQPTAKPLELTQGDSGSAQVLSTGQELRVSLKANPTTGYMWSIDGALPQQLEQVGEPKFTAESTAIGAGGNEVWSFTAASAGEAALKLKYWRSFEPTAPPADTFEVNLSVK